MIEEGNPISEVVALMKMRADCAADIRKIRNAISKELRKNFDVDCKVAYAAKHPTGAAKKKAEKIEKLKAQLAELEA